jgi:hypothetical protein
MAYFKDSSLIASSQQVPRLRLESSFFVVRVLTQTYVLEVLCLDFITEIILTGFL